MPLRRLRCSSSSSGNGSDSSSSGSSSDSSDDERRPTLDPARYRQAQLRRGLLDRQLRPQALAELRGVVAYYATATKAAQAEVFEDVLVAVQQQDSRQAVVDATAALAAAARHAVPQQRRNQLAKAQRQAQIAATRAARRRPGGQGCSSAEEEEDEEDEGRGPVVFGNVPLEVVATILRSLDPPSLAAAACVCRSWHELASGDELWWPQLQLVFPGVARRCQPPQQQQRQGQQPQRLDEAGCSSGVSAAVQAPAACWSVRQQFAAAAKRRPAALLPWRSCRVLLSGKLQWVPPSSALRDPGAVTPGTWRPLAAAPVFVTPEQAVSWMLRRPWGEVVRSGGGTRGTRGPGGGTGGSGTGGGGTGGSGSGGSEIDSDSGGSESHVPSRALRLWAIAR